MLAGLTSEESALRARIHKLQEHDRLARDATRESPEVIRALGADLLWHKWQADQRAQLNMDLARVLARKSAAVQKVGRAFGRKHAVDTLLQADRAAAIRRAQQALMHRLYR